MSWISNLSSTYDQCESLIGKVSGDDNSIIVSSTVESAVRDLY